MTGNPLRLNKIVVLTNTTGFVKVKVFYLPPVFNSSYNSFTLNCFKMYSVIKTN